MNPTPAEDTPQARRPTTRLVALVAAAVVAIAAIGYWRTGTPDYAEQAAQVEAQMRTQAEQSAQGAAPHGADAQQLQAMVAKLEEHLKGKPEDGEGWAMLGRAQATLGQLDPALAAYRRALALRGDDPRLLTDLAELLGIQQGQTLAGEPTRLLDKSLVLDARAPKTLALAGAAAFDRKDYARAAEHWESLLAVSPSDAAFVAQVRSGIAEARKLGGLAAPVDAPAATAAATAQAGPAVQASPKARTPPPAAAASINGTVTLSAALKGRAAPDDTLFVFARAAEGPRMPLALLKKQVKDLPLAFTLDDSMAMSPQMKLSAFPKVIIVARISKSGQATPQPGDLAGESAPVALGSGSVVVEIAAAVP